MSAQSFGPTRHSVEGTVTIDAPADKVWALVRDFSKVGEWVPPVKSVVMQGDDVRVLTLQDGHTITEQLNGENDENKTLRYRIIDMQVLESLDFNGHKVQRTSLPVDTYTSIIKVTANDADSSKVSWSGKFYPVWSFDPPAPDGLGDEDAIFAIKGLYQIGLATLKSHLESDTGAPSAETTSMAAVVLVVDGEPVEGAAPAVAAQPAAVPADTAAAPATEAQPAATPADTAAAPATEAQSAAAATTAAPAADAKPYAEHVQCDADGKNCKIDKFLNVGFRTFGQCQVCHGIDGNGSTIAPSLMLKVKELSKEQFWDRVANGYQGQIGVMPPWKENPNVMKNIENLYDYLRARSDNVIPAGKVDRF
ncbi:MAG: SRPBCC family protein [Thiothrix sp.]|nr:SRPBCC family protein [Thiothrix sp.]